MICGFSQGEYQVLGKQSRSVLGDWTGETMFGLVLNSPHESVRVLHVPECLSKKVERDRWGSRWRGVALHAGTGVSTCGNEEVEVRGDSTNWAEGGVCVVTSSSVVGGNESGDDVVGRL